VYRRLCRLVVDHNVRNIDDLASDPRVSLFGRRVTANISTGTSRVGGRPIRRYPKKTTAERAMASYRIYFLGSAPSGGDTISTPTMIELRSRSSTFYSMPAPMTADPSIYGKAGDGLQSRVYLCRARSRSYPRLLRNASSTPGADCPQPVEYCQKSPLAGDARTQEDRAEVLARAVSFHGGGVRRARGGRPTATT